MLINFYIKEMNNITTEKRKYPIVIIGNNVHLMKCVSYLNKCSCCWPKNITQNENENTNLAQ